MPHRVVLENSHRQVWSSPLCGSYCVIYIFVWQCNICCLPKGLKFEMAVHRAKVTHLMSKLDLPRYDSVIIVVGRWSGRALLQWVLASDGQSPIVIWI